MSLYKGNNLISGAIPNSANQSLSNLNSAGQDKFDAKVDLDLTNVNDTGYIKMAGAGMPSNRYIKLTLGASGTEYTAPADGWFYINKSAGTSGTYLVLENSSNGMQSGLIASQTGQVRAYLPVHKGDVIIIVYTFTGTTNTFRFIYAVGSESEGS